MKLSTQFPDMKRQIKFRAFIDLKKFSVMIDEVQLGTDPTTCGCGIEQLTEALQKVGWRMNDDYEFINEANTDQIETHDAGAHDTGEDFIWFDNCEIMQFTGRTDITPPWENTPRLGSIELYEGDICDAWVSRNPEKKTRGFVVWNDSAQAFQFRYENIIGGRANEFLHQYHFFKMVGNVYQNPKLYEK